MIKGIFVTTTLMLGLVFLVTAIIFANSPPEARQAMPLNGLVEVFCGVMGFLCLALGALLEML